MSASPDDIRAVAEGIVVIIVAVNAGISAWAARRHAKALEQVKVTTVEVRSLVNGQRELLVNEISDLKAQIVGLKALR